MKTIQAVFIIALIVLAGCSNAAAGRVKIVLPDSAANATPTIPPDPTATPEPPVTLPPLEESVPDIAFKLVTFYVDQPTTIAHAGDGSNRLFVLERRGKIRVIDNGRLLAEPFLDIIEQVDSTDIEQGLLGIAFHPNFPQDSRFFIYYSQLDDATTLVSYQVAEDSGQVDLNSAKTLLTISQPFTNHNGGQITFGPDGYLYISVGEGGLAKDPGSNSWLGKILRLDVDNGDPYAIPPDNPFVNNPDFKPEIWAWGMRNPWRLTFDRQTQDMYIADVGENLYEEINLEPAGDPGGHNYGWPIIEGHHCYEAESCDKTGLTLPIVEYTRDKGCSVTGGYVYRGADYPELNGFYIFADYCTGVFWALKPGFAPVELADNILVPTSFGEDEAGELYVADFAGAIYQVIVPRNEDGTNWPGAWPLSDAPSQMVNADFDGDIRLAGFDSGQTLGEPGRVSRITLFWQGEQIPDTRSVFLQVVDPDNNVVVQADHPVYISQNVLTADGTMLRDGATLAPPPDLPPGDYTILVGLYDPTTGERLAVINDQTGQDAVVLTEFRNED